ncbi:hypothetical protein ASPVEDRAFT_24299 [Aspergillus versicolor CBS 583.65]|uniref:Rhodopsin domain-containing protein n=1 Tax=Aspergillus versicolor CBS 583.65 TaxID=1036611 RepID=A0A1L9P748_ASPVE|nr:uncharacterized protein ASPVEDRAFT_24299 [Aspergillus versicolor CBS 583.65]OJI97335.1 hypothetical protein ASPVEDRAFT_24299 [Aspergillus versicolor CBS 583.65]
MPDTREPAVPAPPGAVSNLDNPEDVLHTVNLATQVVCIIVVTIAVGMRVAVKVRLRNGLGLEDYTTITGWVLFIAFCANMLVLNAYGGGYHAWDVSKDQFISFQKASYAVTLLYVPMVFVIKLALLTIMLRLFSPDRQKVIIIYASITILLLYYIPALFIKIFFCKPISTYWLGPEATGGSCIDQRNVIIADSAISIASDLWILILPVPMLWSLQMSLKRKLRVVGILGAGGLATGFSVWRLVMMVEESETVDTTWFWIHAVLTANAEAGIGLICACLPALSSYIASLKSRANSSYRSYKSHELSSWNKLGSSKKGSGNHSSAFPSSQTDQACLISTIEAETPTELRESPEESSGKSRTGNGNGHVHGNSDGAVIHKNVVVEQSYEYVK